MVKGTWRQGFWSWTGRAGMPCPRWAPLTPLSPLPRSVPQRQPLWEGAEGGEGAEPEDCGTAHHGTRPQLQGRPALQPPQAARRRARRGQAWWGAAT